MKTATAVFKALAVAVLTAAGSFPGAVFAQQYQVRLDIPKQTIWGLGVEIQSDSIGSGNNGLPEKTVSVPHDLTPAERYRLATELIGRGHGFRYIRLAGGLYYRGLRNNGQNLDERWPGQLQELSTLIQDSGAEGVNLEYWSPPPAWKSTNSYLGGSLKQFDATFLSQFGDAVVGDISHLIANGVPVVKFGLQNEAPHTVGHYPHCTYTDSQYVLTYNAVGAKIRAAYPQIHLHANSWDGQNRAALRNGLDMNLVDAWTWHRIGANSNDQIDNAAMFNANRAGKFVYNNEFEYLDSTTSEARMMNTAQSIMNWFTFVDAPTWYWLHALKPTYNAEAQGYALGYWRPDDDNDFSKFAHIQKGHFDYELRNWRAIVGFLEWMPWNSQRYQVDEALFTEPNGTQRPYKDKRILAFRQGGPTGKLVVVLTNRDANTPNYTFNLNFGMAGTFRGYRYRVNTWQGNLGTVSGPSAAIAVPTNSIEFWVEQ
jgi:O-glycosyl hydrolase